MHLGCLYVDLPASQIATLEVGYIALTAIVFGRTGTERDREHDERKSTKSFHCFVYGRVGRFRTETNRRVEGVCLINLRWLFIHYLGSDFAAFSALLKLTRWSRRWLLQLVLAKKCALLGINQSKN